MANIWKINSFFPVDTRFVSTLRVPLCRDLLELMGRRRSYASQKSKLDWVTTQFSVIRSPTDTKQKRWYHCSVCGLGCVHLSCTRGVKKSGGLSGVYRSISFLFLLFLLPLRLSTILISRCPTMKPPLSSMSTRRRKRVTPCHPMIPGQTLLEGLAIRRIWSGVVYSRDTFRCEFWNTYRFEFRSMGSHYS